MYICSVAFHGWAGMTCQAPIPPLGSRIAHTGEPMVAEQAKPPKPEPEPSAPLPRGHHDLPRDVVERHQRDRVVAAVASVIAERGYGGLTIERITDVARVSRTTFYNHFANKQEAVLGAHTATFERLLAVIEEAACAREEWPEKVGASIVATFRFAGARPEEAQLLATQLSSADIPLAPRARASHDQLAALLEEGRRLYPDAAALPPLTERVLVASIAAILSRGLVDGELDRFPALAPQLVQLTLIPYLGPAEAARAAASFA